MPDLESDGSSLTLCEPVDSTGGAPVAEWDPPFMIHTLVALPVREFPVLSDLAGRFPQHAPGPPEVTRFHRLTTIRALL